MIPAVGNRPIKWAKIWRHSDGREELFALCNDGTFWVCALEACEDLNDKWRPVRGVPKEPVIDDVPF